MSPYICRQYTSYTGSHHVKRRKAHRAQDQTSHASEAADTQCGLRDEQKSKALLCTCHAPVRFALWNGLFLSRIPILRLLIGGRDGSRWIYADALTSLGKEREISSSLI